MLHQENQGLEVSSTLQVLEPGMYLFRYASQLPESALICFTLQATPLGKGTIDFFPAEGVSRNTLARLGDCIVGRVKSAPAGLLITEYRQTDDDSLQADLRIERIDTSAAIIRQPAMAPAPKALHLQLSGHIEYIGDTSAQGQWLGDPHSQARVEGFCVEWPNRPQDVDIAYQCSVLGAGQLPASLSGGFVGTRRRAAAINAVAFALVGPDAEQYRLAGQAVFAGCAPQAIVQNQELRGATGLEQLVALRLEVFPSTTQVEINAPRTQSPWDSPEVTHSNGAQVR